MSAPLLAQRLADDVFFAFIRHKVASLATDLPDEEHHRDRE